MAAPSEHPDQLIQDLQRELQRYADAGDVPEAIHERSMLLRKIYEYIVLPTWATLTINKQKQAQMTTPEEPTLKEDSDSLNIRAITQHHLPAISEHGLRRLPKALERLHHGDGKIMPVFESMQWIEYHLDREPSETLQSVKRTTGIGLGEMLRLGKAKEVLGKASEGDRRALIAVAFLVRTAVMGDGNGLPFSQEWASAFFRSSAQEDLSAACYEVARGYHFQKGDATPSDMDHAVSFYYLSSTSGAGTSSILSLYALAEILSSSPFSTTYKRLAMRLLTEGESATRPSASSPPTDATAPVPPHLLRLAASPESFIGEVRKQWREADVHITQAVEQLSVWCLTQIGGAVGGEMWGRAPVGPVFVTPEMAYLLVLGQNYEMGLNGFGKDLDKALEAYVAAGDNPFALFRRYTITFKLKLMDPSNETLQKSYKTLHYRAVAYGSLQACSDFGVAYRYTLLNQYKKNSGSNLALFSMIVQALQWMERHADRDPSFGSGRVFSEAYMPTLRDLAKRERMGAGKLMAKARKWEKEREGDGDVFVILGHLVRFLGVKEVYPGFFFAGVSANVASAMYEVARGYQFGNHLTPPDLVLATCWYHEAARTGLSQGDLHTASLSLAHLSDLYTFGIPPLRVSPNPFLVNTYRASTMRILELIETLPCESHGLFEVKLDLDALAPLPIVGDGLLNVAAILERERKMTVAEVTSSLFGLLDSIEEGIVAMPNE
ncbi:hypothetical protein HDU67_000494 [Dinochytrium kinnereticum]|nr:hypothetical protein HDU67_000494 [Dinochytrium kinnereticum]